MKRILVISKDHFELSSEEVMDWLWSSGHQIKRLNGDCFEQNRNRIHFEQESGNLKLSIDDINIEDFDTVWLRRWSDAKWSNDFDIDLPFAISQGIVTNIARELGAVRELLFYKLKSKMKLTNSNQLAVNKLIVFEKATKVGFTIPDYLITNRREDLEIFNRKHHKIVCKDIDCPLLIHAFHEQALTFVELIDSKFISKLPDTFMMSIFQAYIDKDIELRTFVLDSEIYSMAIFSQKDSKTAVDFRKYNTVMPNRNVPYQLPDKIEIQIRALMQELNLVTGSIDLIRTKDGRYIFLEINPVGQFGMVSHPCNYRLEQKIANYLSM